jgi:hypothetical protein
MFIECLESRPVAARSAREIDSDVPRSIRAYSMAAVWAIDGNSDAAMLQLEKSAEYREPVLMLVKVDQAFDSLRRDNRFIALERRLGLLD